MERRVHRHGHPGMPPGPELFLTEPPVAHCTGPVNADFARCVVDQKCHALGVKRSRSLLRQGFATRRMAFLAATRRERD
jgi:hypothetical protein